MDGTSFETFGALGQKWMKIPKPKKSEVGIFENRLKVEVYEVA